MASRDDLYDGFVASGADYIDIAKMSIGEMAAQVGEQIDEWADRYSENCRPAGDDGQPLSNEAIATAIIECARDNYLYTVVDDIWVEWPESLAGVRAMHFDVLVERVRESFWPAEVRQIGLSDDDVAWRIASIIKDI
jgi:hypothetical protein